MRLTVPVHLRPGFPPAVDGRTRHYRALLYAPETPRPATANLFLSRPQALLPRDAPVPVLAATPGTHLPDPPDSPLRTAGPMPGPPLIPAVPGLL
jgi:hypothetical protein